MAYSKIKLKNAENHINNSVILNLKYMGLWIFYYLQVYMLESELVYFKSNYNKSIPIMIFIGMISYCAFMSNELNYEMH